MMIMPKARLITAYFLLLLLVACTVEKKQTELPHFNLGDSESVIEIPSLFKKATVIPISEKDVLGPVLFSDIYAGHIYALNEAFDAMAKYDMEGNQVGFMRRLGNGHGEYTMISDFYIHGDSIYILCWDKILVADTDFKIGNIIDLDKDASQIAVSDDGIFLYSKNLRTLYRLTDKGQETIRDDGPLPSFFPPFNRVFYKTDKGLLFAPYAAGMVYGIEGSELKPVFSFTSSGFEEAMEKFSSTTPLDFMEKLKYSVPIIYDIFKNDGFYYVVYTDHSVFRLLKLSEDMELIEDGGMSKNLIYNSFDTGAMAFVFVEDDVCPVDSSAIPVNMVRKDSLPTDYPAVILFE